MGRSKNKKNREKRRDSRPPVPEEGAHAGAGGGGRGARDQAAGDVRTRAIKAYEKAIEMANEMHDWYINEIKQESVEEMERFTLTTNPTRQDILIFLAKKKTRSLNIASIIVPALVYGDRVQVPVTPATPENLEDRTYHIIVLKDPTTGDEIHILVEECSGYIKAFRVVKRTDVASKKRWHLLRPEGLPTRFKKTSHTTYADAYVNLDSVCIHSGTFRAIFEFFFSFDKKPGQKRTHKNQIILDTTFVCLGELPRFEIVQRFLFEGLTRPENDPLKLPVGFNGLIHDWGALSKAIFQLFLATVEAKMVRLGMSAPLSRKAMVKARRLWRERQKFHSLIRFYFEDLPLDLGSLCGGQVHLLCHDRESCDQVTMRSTLRYKGFWLKEIQLAFDSGELAAGTH